MLVSTFVNAARTYGPGAVHGAAPERETRRRLHRVAPLKELRYDKRAICATCHFVNAKTPEVVGCKTS